MNETFESMIFFRRFFHDVSREFGNSPALLLKCILTTSKKLRSNCVFILD